MPSGRILGHVVDARHIVRFTKLVTVSANTAPLGMVLVSSKWEISADGRQIYNEQIRQNAVLAVSNTLEKLNIPVLKTNDEAAGIISKDKAQKYLDSITAKGGVKFIPEGDVLAFLRGMGDASESLAVKAFVKLACKRIEELK